MSPICMASAFRLPTWKHHSLISSHYARTLLSAIIYCFLIYNATLHHKLRCFLLLLLSTNNTPPTYTIIGCLFSFFKNRHRLLSWYTDLLSSSPTQTVVIRRLGARKTIITANPKNVEYMLKTNFINFPKGKPFTDILMDFLGHGIFNVDGDLWLAQRKLASHQFSSRNLKLHVETIVKESLETKLFPLLDCLSEGNKAVDLQEVLRRLGFDIVCRLSLGFDPCCLGDDGNCLKIMKAFDKAGEISAKREASTPFANFWKVKKMLGVGLKKILKDSVKEIHEFISKIINERKINISVLSESKDLLSRMIIAGENEDLIRDMLISFIMAGRDTTSAAMTWLFYILSRNPEVEEKLAEEPKIKFKFGKDGLYESLKEMKYLQACICETMRLYPPVSWDSKHAVNDDVLPDGTKVKGGDRVTYFPYGMGRMEKLWGADRMEFRPDRWFECKPEEVSPFKFPVFHGGPRVCIGKGLANVQMSYVVASIVERYEIRPVVEEQEAFYLPLLTAFMDGGFMVFVWRRGVVTHVKMNG